VAAWRRGDVTEALRNWRGLAEQGDIIAANNLGYLYEVGSGVEKNLDSSLQWYLRAANAGAAIGQFNVGEAYMLGRGVRTDPVEAAKWFMLAARAGELDAIKQLGELKQTLSVEQIEEARSRALLWQRERASGRKE
jgi:uncharacterized protein